MRRGTFTAGLAEYEEVATLGRPRVIGEHTSEDEEGSRLTTIRVALGQIEVSPADVAGNLTRAAGAVTDAQRSGADLLVLPEALDVGWADPRAAELAAPLDRGRPLAGLRAAARAASIHVCAGLTERDGDAVYNTAVLIDPKGEVLLRHRKIHELDFAAEVYAQGDTLTIAETSLGAVGVVICADAFAPGQALTRALAQMGAGIIVCPCAWAVPPGFDNEATPYGDEWRAAYGAVARDYGIPIVGVSGVGTIERGAWAGYPMIGASIVVGPDGRQMHQMPYDRPLLEVLEVEVGQPGRLVAPSR